jgi:predicted permease
MRSLRALLLRLGGLFRKDRQDAEFSSEMESHLQLHIEDNLRAGMSAEEARREALIKLGGIEQTKESYRERRGLPFLETLFQDVRFGARMLRKNPGFTAVAVLTLALGIGANTAVFELLNAVLLRPLPVHEPQQLAAIRIADLDGGLGISHGIDTDVTNPIWEQIRLRQQAFSEVFAWGGDEFRLGQPPDVRRVRGLWLSGEAFAVLGLPPARGRLFRPDDDRPGCASASAVISYGFWQSEFGGLDSAIGKILTVDDHRFEVIGVAPSAFFGLEVGKDFDIALPICSQMIFGNSSYALERRDVWWLSVMGRLQPSWTFTQASAHLNTISPSVFEATVPAGYEEAQRNKYRQFRLKAYPAANGFSGLRKVYDSAMWLLLGFSGLVLLIVCTNLANLLLAKEGARKKEMAVRLALGASRVRLIRQMLSESLLLAVGGALLGSGVAGVLGRGIVRLVATEGNPIQLELGADWRVLAFTVSVTILTCVAFGLFPAFRSSCEEPAAAMRAGGRGLTASRKRFSFQRLLVASQIAVSLVLLVSALLFVRSFRNLMTLDPGFQKRGILAAFMNLTRLHLPQERRAFLQQELLDRVRAIPQVESVAATTVVPLSGSSWTMAVRVAGGSEEQQGSSKVTWVSPQYFQTMGIPFVRGRDFIPHDAAAAPRVAVVNEAFVRRFLGKGSPMGRTVRTVAEPKYPETLYEIVGIVKDTKYEGLREEVPPICYAPLTQHPAPGPWVQLVVRSSAPMPDVVTAIVQTAAGLDPDILTEFSVLETRIRDGLARERLMAALSGFFGGLAGVLAGIGLYGVISYVTTMRVGEMGIRMALGASRGHVLGLILRDAGGLLVKGVAAGTVLSLVAARSAAALLFGLQPYDLTTLILAVCSLAAITALASFIPARRASRLDPMVALRYE